MIPLRAQRREQRGVGRRWGAHEDEVGGAVGDLRHVGDGLYAEYDFGIEVGAVDRPAVSRRQEVVQRHESELAGVRRGPGDDDPAWLEQGGKLFGGWWRPTPARRHRRSVGAQLDKGVDGDGATIGGDLQRVHVDALHVVPLGDHRADGDEDCGESLAVDC